MREQTNHHVNGHSFGDIPQGHTEIRLGMGCFWGAERLFWQQQGVYVTEVGYGGGNSPDPTYKQVCTGTTNHAELVRVVYDPNRLKLEILLGLFWQSHDPTQGNRQGNDVGSQYRSVIFVDHEQDKNFAEKTKLIYQDRLNHAGFGKITTQIKIEPEFHPAEEYHQQYLAKNQLGYCGLSGTGINYPFGNVA